MFPLTSSPPRSADTGSSSDPTSRSSPRTPSPLGPHHHSQSLTPPTRASLLPTPPPTAARGRLRSSGAHDLSPVRSPGQAATLVPITRVASAPAAPQSTVGASAYLPTSLATSEPTLFSFASLTPSRSRSSATSPERGAGHEADGDGSITPTSTWWSHHVHPPRPWAEHSKRKHTVPVEQAEEYVHTRSRAIEAIGGVLGTAARIGHEALFVGVDLLQFAPVPGLELAGGILLNIWDAVQMVEMNRLASLRLTERCADILISVREEIADAGYTVAEELHAPIAKLVEAFGEVHHFLKKLGHRPFLKRYLRRDEIQTSITNCDTALDDALGMLGLSIQIRTLKLIQANELRRQKETRDLLETLSHLSPGLPPVPLPLSPSALQSSPADPDGVRLTLNALRATQNAQDRAHDAADLRQLMRTALATNDDASMIDALQIARSEMPEAIKTLQRALERVVEDGQLDAEESTTPLLLAPAFDPGASRRSADTLDREFIETGIDALRRMSRGTDLGLPSWTVTRYEIDLETKVGVGFFSDVFRGRWREHTVAIKVLAETTPRKIFVHEVEIWKTLYHPNVLELLGASSASGDPPWFLVSKYYPRGSLVKYLKGLSDADAARVDVLKMIHEISKGMAYLHKQGVLHGDLKAANILVDDDTRCVISDFGQSEMKSEVYRISRAPQPHGTLRWQAPELMQGAQTLTPAMDVYAFAICCVEILTMGALPWPLMDDDAVRRFVLNDNMRPSLPPSSLIPGQLMNTIRSSWDRVPSNRPSFEKIARELKKQRAEWSAQSVNSPTFDTPRPVPLVVEWDAQNPHRSHHSPDILPRPLPGDSSPVTPHEPQSSGPRQDIPEDEESSLSSVEELSEVAPLSRPVARPLDSMSTNTLTSDTGVEPDQSVLASGYLTPLDPDDIAAKYRDERRYRMLLQHDYHTILTLPLWQPSHVELGAVGFLSKPDGRFETLFNAFEPGATSGGKADELPMLSGYGKVLKGSQRQDKRNAAQRGLDRVHGLFSSTYVQPSRRISRTQSFQLRALHKVAFIYAESTMYRYITNVDVPKKWFQSNIDHIMKIYGREQHLTREDIYLVIGALDAPDYASFVSHSHPDGQVTFNVFASAHVARPWGEFALTSAEQVMEPSRDPVQQDMVGAVTASNVSLVKNSSEPWDSVLLARLRFKPDIPEPTSL
ncbi:hypothetical protein EDB85DRAFT_1876352 [Lactarius pseudohatsudake]|nr:hypothetical protein EDB85DRAFT_1876352 [Lactarius pseudohatsudake]